MEDENYVSTLKTIVIKSTMRIVVLERELKEYKSGLGVCMTDEQFEIYTLEQRAKGIMDGAKASAISLGGDSIVIGETELDDYAKDLLRQAKALRE